MLELRPGLWLASASPCESAASAATRAAPQLPRDACVLALVRAAFLPDGEPPPPLRTLVASLGQGVVALAASCVQQPSAALFVDAFDVSALDLSAPAEQQASAALAVSVPLPAYLHSWCARRGRS